jgi:tetratricopeptide (TPR) repeat protein
MIFLLYLFIPLLSLSVQAGPIDSLKTILKSTALGDEERVKILIDLADRYASEQLDSSSAYADHALLLARNINLPEPMAQALIRKGLVLSNDNNEKEALELFRQAESIIRANKYRELEVTLYASLARTFRKAPDSAMVYYAKSIKLAEELGLKEHAQKNKIKSSLILLHQKRHQEFSELMNSIIPQLEQAKDHEGLAETYTYMSLGFRDLNEKEKSLMYAQKALDLTQQINDRKLRAFVLGAIGAGVTGFFESFDEAEPLINESLLLANLMNDKTFVRNTYKRLALLHYNNSDFLSAARIVDSLITDSVDPDVFKIKGLILSEDRKYQEAAHYYDKAYELYEQDGAFVHQRMILLLKIDNKLDVVGDKELIDDFKKLETINEVINNAESKSHFFELETKYRTAEKEAEIQKKELALAESRTRNLFFLSLALVTFLVGVFGVWFLRSKQRRRELEYKNQVLSMQNDLNVKEMESLNNQLNPHEVKNLLASLAPELLTQAPDAYRKMIKLFNVTRASLSDKLTEPLQAQLHQVEDYLQLQQSISSTLWQYRIENQTEECGVELPRLLLKNMVENAVKYGMKSVVEGGMIVVEVGNDADDLTIIVRDNGEGIDGRPAEESTGKGISVYQKLFDLTNAKNQRRASVSLNRSNSWTLIHIKVPLDYRYQ